MPRQSGGVSFTPQWNFNGDSYQLYNSLDASYHLIQLLLVSGTNIKTINGNSLLGSGNLVIGGGGGSGTTTNVITFNTTGGATPGTTFDGSVPVTIDYSTIGAASDANALHKTGNETATGNKTLSNTLYTNEGIYSRNGASGTGILRSGAQLVASNYGGAPGLHGLISIENHDKTDEGALTWYSKLSTSAAQQLGATYARFTLANDDPSTFIPTIQTHIPGTVNGDNVTHAMYGNNSSWFNAGSLSNAITNWGAYQWDIVPPADKAIFGGTGVLIGNEFALSTYTPISGFSFENRSGAMRVADGATNIGVELGYSTGNNISFINSYNRATPGYAPLIMQATDFYLNGNVIFDSTPTITNSGNATLNFNRGTTSTAAGLTLKTAGTSNWGLGTAYGLSSTTDFNLYNFGTGTSPLRINYSTNVATFLADVTAPTFTGSGVNLTGITFNQVLTAGSSTALQPTFTAGGKAFTHIPATGNAGYYSVDMTGNAGGKLFRIGNTGAGLTNFNTLGFYNQTDNVPMLEVTAAGNGVFAGTVAGDDAVNPTEFVTKQQMDAAVSGVGGLLASNTITAQTTPQTFITQATGGSDKVFEVGGFATITSASAVVFNLRVSFTDENNNAQINDMVLNASTNGQFSGGPVVIKAKASTNIVISATLTGSCTYNAGAYIKTLF